jgi:hypothetical protein
MKWVSIDPGWNGAIVVWDDSTPVGLFRIRTELGSRKYGRVLNGFEGVPAIVEKVWGIKSDSSAGAFSFGFVCGMIHQHFDVKHYVAPVKWMNIMHKGLPKAMDTKERSLTVAKLLYGEKVEEWKALAKQDDGVWDALLLGHYAKKEGLV